MTTNRTLVVQGSVRVWGLYAEARFVSLSDCFGNCGRPYTMCFSVSMELGVCEVGLIDAYVVRIDGPDLLPHDTDYCCLPR